jgi:muconolactone delta-isomerase
MSDVQFLVDLLGKCHDALQPSEVERLRSLALDMGRVIRLLDESGEHAELWTQDGDYIIDGRFA